MSNYLLTKLLSVKTYEMLTLEIKAGAMNDLPINCYALCASEGCYCGLPETLGQCNGSG